MYGIHTRTLIFKIQEPTTNLPHRNLVSTARTLELRVIVSLT
jgi:hypothetical protein